MEARPRTRVRTRTRGRKSPRERANISPAMKNVRNNFPGFSEIILPGPLCVVAAVAALPLSSLFYTLAENVLNPASGFTFLFLPGVPPAGKRDGLRAAGKKVPTLSVSDVTLLFLLYCA